MTGDHERTLKGLVRLGIGPFPVYTFDSGTLADQTYGGGNSLFSLKVCFATNLGLTFETMQPLSGRILRGSFDRQRRGCAPPCVGPRRGPWASGGSLCSPSAASRPHRAGAGS